jgi:hypothetical protein
MTKALTQDKHFRRRAVPVLAHPTFSRKSVCGTCLILARILHTATARDADLSQVGGT